MQKGIVTEAMFFFQVNGLEDLKDFLRIEKADELFLHPLLWDGEYSLCQFCSLRADKADHFGEGLQGSQALIPGFCTVFTISLEIIQEGQDEVRRQVIKAERGDFDGVIVCGKG